MRCLSAPHQGLSDRPGRPVEKVVRGSSRATQILYYASVSESKPTSGLAVSRVLMLGWCFWLLISWAVNLALFPARRTWVAQGDILVWRVPAEAFVPVVRAMFVSVAVGWMLIWPAWRLSSSGTRPGRQTAIDFAALWLITQVVVWPMRFLADLSPGRLAMISLTFAVWGAAAAVPVWLGRRYGSHTARAAAMLLCATLALGGWPIAYALGDTTPAAFSPLHTLWTLCGGSPDASAVVFRLSAVAAAVLMAWIAGLVFTGRESGSAGQVAGPSLPA